MAAAATIVASNTLRVHMLVSSFGLPKVQVTFPGVREVPVESFTQVGPDRPCSSDCPYLELPPELLAPAVEPAPVDAGEVESHFSFLNCASVGVSCAHSAALDFFALFEPEVEPLLLLALEPEVWPYELPCAWPVLPLAMEPPWPLEALVPAAEPSTPAPLAEPLEPIEPEVLPFADAALPLLIELPCPLEAPVEDDDGLDDVVLAVPLVPELCVVVASALDAFLFLFMSPSASADPLVSATIDVRMNAGASLRIWASKVECG